MFKNPDHKSNENEKTKTCDPKVPCQRPQENPCIFVIVFYDRNDHGDTTFRVRQGKINIQGPVEDDGCISHHSIIILLVVAMKLDIHQFLPKQDSDFMLNDCSVIRQGDEERLPASTLDRPDYHNFQQFLHQDLQRGCTHKAERKAMIPLQLQKHLCCIP